MARQIAEQIRSPHDNDSLLAGCNAGFARRGFGPWLLLFLTMPGEKKITEMTLRLSDTLKRDLQDVAMLEDRSLSDMIRVLLEDALYGLKHRRDQACAIDDSRQTMRGD